jgi:hypothetical protein
MERSLRTVGTGRGSGSVRLIARTQCDDLSLLNRVRRTTMKVDDGPNRTFALNDAKSGLARKLKSTELELNVQ